MTDVFQNIQGNDLEYCDENSLLQILNTRMEDNYPTVRNGYLILWSFRDITVFFPVEGAEKLLCLACCNGDNCLVEKLVTRGVDINIRDIVSCH